MGKTRFFSPLQEKIIDSLTQLSENSPHAARIHEIIDELRSEDIYIPASDYSGVINFVLIMLQEMPDLLKNNSNDRMLKNLCRDCIMEFNALAESTALRKNNIRGF